MLRVKAVLKASMPSVKCFSERFATLSFDVQNSASTSAFSRFIGSHLAVPFRV
ncbi:hypothetical protein ACLK1T_01790 [Escherichia coli]